MISVCVAYWERQAALDQMFETYRDAYGSKVGGHELEFSVCDDGSPTPAYVPEGITLTRLPAKPGPLNPCVPLNAAVTASHGEIIVLTNPEIEHREPTLARMLEQLTHEDDYVVASCLDSQRGWLSGPQVNYQTGGRLPVPAGAHFHFCAMLHRSLWEKAGGFDEDYRGGQACDDNDFTWRLHRAGARFKTCLSVVYHLHLTPDIRWNLPHNRDLFRQKWPRVT